MSVLPDHPELAGTPIVLPRCESCERNPATVTVRFRTGEFLVCASCLPDDLYVLDTTEGTSHGHL